MQPKNSSQSKCNLKCYCCIYFENLLLLHPHKNYFPLILTFSPLYDILPVAESYACWPDGNCTLSGISKVSTLFFSATYKPRRGRSLPAEAGSGGMGDTPGLFLQKREPALPVQEIFEKQKRFMDSCCVHHWAIKSYLTLTVYNLYSHSYSKVSSPEAETCVTFTALPRSSKLIYRLMAYFTV